MRQHTIRHILVEQVRKERNSHVKRVFGYTFVRSFTKGICLGQGD